MGCQRGFCCGAGSSENFTSIGVIPAPGKQVSLKSPTSPSKLSYSNADQAQERRRQRRVGELSGQVIQPPGAPHCSAKTGKNNSSFAGPGGAQIMDTM